MWCEAAAQPKLEDGLGIGGFGYPVSLLFPWMNVFRINPEFRILRLTFHIESQPQNADLGGLYTEGKKLSNIL